MQKPELPLKVKLRDRHANQFPLFKLALDRQARNQGHAIPHGHKSLDRLQAGQFHPHIQRSFMVGKRFDYLPPQWGRHVMGDKIFSPEIADGNTLLAGQWMAGVYYKGQFVGVNRDRAEVLLLGPK